MRAQFLILGLASILISGTLVIGLTEDVFAPKPQPTKIKVGPIKLLTVDETGNTITGVECSVVDSAGKPIVGKNGEEVFPDKHGRVKVQFPWLQSEHPDNNILITCISDTQIASIKSNVNEKNNGFNEIRMEDKLGSGADLGVTIKDIPDPALVGVVVTYTLTVTNAGPVMATGVILETFLPPEVSRPIIFPVDCSVVVNRVTCDLGTFSVGEVSTIDVGFGIQGDDNTVSVIASVFAEQPDPNTANNRAVEEIETR